MQESTSSALNPIIIPWWISRVLERNNLDTIDILNFSKLRAVLADMDLAELLCLNLSSAFETYPLRVLGDSLNRHDYGALITAWSSTTGQAVSENDERFRSIDNILSLAKSTLTIKSVTDRLKEQNTATDVTRGSDQQPIAPHSVNIIDCSRITITVRCGFVNALGDREYLKGLLSDYLKACYSLRPMTEVSTSMAFKRYIDLL